MDLDITRDKPLPGPLTTLSSVVDMCHQSSMSYYIDFLSLQCALIPLLIDP